MNSKDKNIIIEIVEKSKISNENSKGNIIMSVKNETIKSEQNELVDDISNEEVKNNMNDEENINEDLMAQLKAKMAAKNASTVVEEKKDMTVRIVEKKKNSIDFGIIGSGQAGSRIAAAFASLGAKAVVFNTAQQDLDFINLPNENKYLLDFTLGGAAKDLSIGEGAASAHEDGIRALISDKLNDTQVLLFCLSLGGGSGAGSAPVILPILSEFGKPIVVITVLPMTTDDAQTKQNAIITLSKLASMAQSKQISNLIVIDNSRIETIFADVSQMDFFDVSNHAIVGPIDAFNKFSAQPSKVKSLDSMEWAKLITDSHGLSTYGELTVNNYEEPTAIAESVIESLQGGLLAGGFDLKQANYVGVLFVGNTKVMQSIPSANVNYAMSLIRETSPSASGIFRGLYEDDSMSDSDGLKVYSMFSGLGLPESRINQLKKEAKEETDKMKGREQTRNLSLQLDTGTEETASAADKVREMIKKKSSTFSKNFVGLKDFRKK